MKRIILLALIFSLTLSCSQFNSITADSPDSLFDLPKVNQGPVIAKVNNTEIHQGLLDVLSELNPRIQAQLAKPLTRKKIISSLVEQQLLFDEAVKQGLNKDDSVLLKSLLNKHVIISNTLLEKETDKAMLKAYEDKKASQFTKVNVSLIAAYFEPETAKKPKDEKPIAEEQKQKALERITAIKAKLNTGEDFAELAKKESDEKMTARKGGAAGKIARDDSRFKRLGYSALTDLAFQLKKGEVSDPVELHNGYYLLKVTSDPFIIPYDEAKRVLGFELQNAVKENLIAELKKNAKIDYPASMNIEEESKPATQEEPVSVEEQPQQEPEKKTETTN